jgi:ABC transport system ATP-binding/permease protein
MRRDMAAAPILALQDIKLTLGSTQLLEGAELSVVPGDKIALVGRNGSGKSTLLKIAAGEIEPDGGKRFVQPGVTIRYLPQ